MGNRIARVRAELADAIRQAGRDSSAVELIAVSKTQPASAVREACNSGLSHFGENYLNEALQKIADCADLPITWHYIGVIQSNKTRALAENFQWIHTLARDKIATRLNSQCPPDKTLNVCLQINVDGDENKAGIEPGQAADLLTRVHQECPRLRLRGLMTILHPDTDPIIGYGQLADIFDNLADIAPEHWDTLSMGMSADYVQAVAAGATFVRVGTAIFGPRLDRKPNATNI